jgi:hypothetical protein
MQRCKVSFRMRVAPCGAAGGGVSAAPRGAAHIKMHCTGRDLCGAARCRTAKTVSDVILIKTFLFCALYTAWCRAQSE